MKHSLLAANPRFRYLFLGQTLSFFGNAVYGITISWHVFDVTGSSVQVALLLIAGFLPQVLLGLFLGVLADRWNRRRLMQISDLIRMAVTALLAISISIGTFELWQIYLVTICISLADLLFSTAQNAWLPDIVDQNDIIKANSLMSSSRQVNRLLGAAVGGVLIAMLGVSLAIWVNAATFLLSWGFLKFIRERHKDTTRERTSESGVWQEIRAGLRWLRGQPLVLLLVWVGMVSNVALGPTNVLPPMLIQTELRADAAGLGVFDAAIGLGLLIGSIAMAALTPKQVGRWFALGLGVQAVGMLVVSQSANLYAACLGNFLIGMAVMIASIPLSTMLQVLAPSEMRGRISSVMSIGLSMAIPITYGGIGLLAEVLSSRNIYLMGAGLLLICSVMAVISPSMRGYSLNKLDKSSVSG